MIKHKGIFAFPRKMELRNNENYGEYQAGAEVNARNPLVNYTKADVEASEVVDGGDK